ncbi:restriction endonuclease subunit S [Aeromonas caviae]|uniref:restriction endonuclease subunit S n=1 Tax=Aeromonas caviae TaxID=648 RepID=UPI0038D03112
MCSEWPLIPLRDFVDLLAGFAFKSTGYSDGQDDVRLLRGDNIAPGRVRWDGVKRWSRENAVGLERYALEPGDVVLAMDRPWIPAGLKVAQVQAADTPSYLVQRVARIRPASREDCSFLFALLSTPEFESYIQNVTTGTAVPHISAKQILDFEFRLPPAYVRAKVGEIVAALNERITLLRETNTTLEAIAQALFKSWFVDFDPVHARARGEQPAGLAPEVAALFPDSFEESALGLVPNGWCWRTMDDVSTVGIGKTPPRKEPQWFSENLDDVPWVSIKDMGTAGVFINNTSEFLTPASIDRFNVRVVPDNTVLLSFKLTVGRLSITDGEMVTNEAIAHFKLGEDSPLSSAYIYLALRQFNFESLSSTSSIAEAVNSKTVRAIPILVPSPSLVTMFNDYANPIFNRIKLLEKQAQTLANLRDTLLPRLISGQLRLPDAEQQLKDLAV